MNNLFTFVPVADNRRALRPNMLSSRARSFEDLIRDWVDGSRILHFEREKTIACSYVSIAFEEDGEILGKACLHTATALVLCPGFAPLDETLIVSRSLPITGNAWIKERNRRLGIHGRRAPASRLMELALSYALSSSGSARLSLHTPQPRFVKLELKYAGNACSWSERFFVLKAKIGVLHTRDPEHRLSALGKMTGG